MTTTKVPTPMESLWQCYAGCWSATPERRREELSRAVSSSVTYRDPHQESRGIDALSDVMNAFRTQLPDHSFAIDSVTVHHNRSLASWRLVNRVGQVRMRGTSTATHDDAGRLLDVTGFFEGFSSNVPRVALVVTSHGELGATGRATGLWLEELASPYELFVNEGCEVVIASPRGGSSPIDPLSRSAEGVTPASRRFEQDLRAMERLSKTVRLDALEGEFDMVFLVGGHGTMWDFPSDGSLGGLIRRTVERDGVVASVCHGAAGLLAAPEEVRRVLCRDRALTGFSNAEESMVGATEVVPFLLEDRLREEGARYSATRPFGLHVVQEGRLVTGQNPGSSAACARLALDEVRATLARASQAA